MTMAWRLIPALFLLLVVAGVFRPSAASSAQCPVLPIPQDVTITPSNCIDFGGRFTLETHHFDAGQIVSVFVTGASGIVGGADRTARVDGDGVLRMSVDSANFYGAAIGGGDYYLYLKDFTGRYLTLRVPFHVEPAPTPTPTRTPTPTPTATVTPTPTRTPAATTTGTVADGAAPVATPNTSDVSISVSCATNPERITLTNNSVARVFVFSVGSLHQPRDEEPFRRDDTLNRGASITYESGSNARTNVITSRQIFDDTNGAEGVVVQTSAGEITRRCR